jgi:hypothetical protein
LYKGTVVRFESVFGIVGMASDPFICKIPFVDHEVCVHARAGMPGSKSTLFSPQKLS